jgi:imidazoleglycerol-phosphate dehydratase
MLGDRRPNWNPQIEWKASSVNLALVSARVAAQITKGSGSAAVATGLPVLDHLLTLLARAGGFDLTLELAPADAEAEVADAGRALGEAVADLLRADDAPGHGSAFVPADEVGVESQRVHVVGDRGPHGPPL